MGPSDEAREFFRALCRPFRPDELKTKKMGRDRDGKEFFATYVKKSALENRLDEVAGPANWRPAYDPVPGGFACRLAIRIPTTQGEWEWVEKADGGGYRGMEKKVDGKVVVDTNNDVKSAFTSAFVRTAEGPWGIGRYLYREGVPDFLADLFPANASPAAQGAPRRDSGRGNDDRRLDQFKAPRTGKQLYPWAKSMESHFGVSVLNGITASARQRGWPTFTGELDEAQTQVLAAEAMTFLRNCDEYRGEFDSQIPGRPVQRPEPPPRVETGIKREIVDLLQAVCFATNGTPPDADEMAANWDDISRQVLGDTAGPLRNMSNEIDLKKVRNYLVSLSTRAAATADKDDSDIAF